MKDVIQSDSGLAHRNVAKANREGGRRKSVKEGINAPSRQTIVQPKLELTTPGDSYEREADRMADFVMQKGGNAPAEMPSATSVFPPVLSRRASSSAGVAVDTATESGIHASHGGGQPMPAALRSQMESGFGADFSGVRLHTDNVAVQMNHNLQAKAFTYGNDIFFNSGQYQPHSAAGQHLIAHELTHVVQQSGKVGREEDNNNSSGHPMYSYVRDRQWINDYVLSDMAANRKLEENYKKTREEKPITVPITVIIYTDARAACGQNRDGQWGRSQEQSRICPFEEKVNQNWKGNGIRGFIENESRTNVFMLQGLNNLDEYQKKLEQLTQQYGPLGNLIIRVHGSPESVELNDGIKINTQSNDFFYQIKKLFDAADKEKGSKMSHSILFSECLTGANTDTPEGLVNHVKCIMGPNIHVRGNKASVYTSDVSYGYFNTNKQICDANSPLTFINHEDPTSPVNGVCASYSNRPKDRVYLGRNIKGALYEIKRHIETKEPYSLSLGYNLFAVSSNSNRERSVKIYYYNSNRIRYIDINSVDILDIIKQKITSEPDGVLSFIKYILSGKPIPINVNNTSPSVTELLYNGAKINPYPNHQ